MLTADFPSVCFGSLFPFFDCVPKEVPSFTMRPYIFWWWQTDNPSQVCMLILFLVSLYFTSEGACLYDRKNIIKALSSCHQSLVANYFLPSYMLRFWRPSEQAFLLSRTQRPFTPLQWMELEHQAVMYNLNAMAPVLYLPACSFL